MSIPVYGLLAYTYQRSRSLESGVKYLVLSATASAMLLMGMAYIYAYTGSLSFYDSVQALFNAIRQPMVILGLALVILRLPLNFHWRHFINGHLMFMQVRQRQWRPFGDGG